jgi:transglutaminase-like putative cysteine protease
MHAANQQSKTHSAQQAEQTSQQNNTLQPKKQGSTQQNRVTKPQLNRLKAMNHSSWKLGSYGNIASYFLLVKHFAPLEDQGQLAMLDCKSI